MLAGGTPCIYTDDLLWKIEQKRNLKSHLQALTLLAMKPERPKSILCTNPPQPPQSYMHTVATSDASM